MVNESIDDILAGEEELVPSSGFLASVMERVREEAAAPPPIPFPWRRAIPGMVLAAGVLGWGTVELVHYAVPAIAANSMAPVRIPAAFLHPLEQAGWVAMALGVSLVSWLASRRISGQSGLL